MMAHCPKCESITKEIYEGSSRGIACTQCDWSVITTYISPIELDTIQYEIKIKSGDFSNKHQIEAVSSIAGVNFLKARDLLKKSGSTIFRGTAVETRKAQDTLMKAKILTTITPDFPW